MAVPTASLAPAACEYLADVGVAAVASDTAACDVAAKDGKIIAGHGHSRYFLPRGILIVEGLRHLADVPSSGLMVVLPLKINGGTGSPVRVSCSSPMRRSIRAAVVCTDGPGVGDSGGERVSECLYLTLGGEHHRVQ
jgi:hypothetical protein